MMRELVTFDITHTASFSIITSYVWSSTIQHATVLVMFSINISSAFRFIATFLETLRCTRNYSIFERHKFVTLAIRITAIPNKRSTGLC